MSTPASAPLSLYIHIPFCVRKCRYCDFLSGPADEEARERYVQALITEIRVRSSSFSGQRVDTVFFGGGTPSVLTADELEQMMNAVRGSFQLEPSAEISMEVNPGTADREKFRCIREIGVNRISLGVQSFQDRELHLLGRIHTAEQARTAFEDARAAGFVNINLDLMSALPGQTFPELRKSLEEACRLRPEHLSVYSLIIEPGTPFYEMYESGRLPELPPDEEDRAMYHFTGRYLAEQGYDRYEISNYARPGFECRHNSGYWTGHEYLGLGLGASSMYEHCRFRNTEKMSDYLAAADTADALGDASESTFDGTPDHAAETASENTVRTMPSTENTAEFTKPCTGNTAELFEKTEKESCSDGRKNVCFQNTEKAARQKERGFAFCTEVTELSGKDQMEEFMFLGLRRMQGVREADFEERFRRRIDEVYGPVIARHVQIGTLVRWDGRIFLSERGIDVSNSVMADFLLDGPPGYAVK